MPVDHERPDKEGTLSQRPSEGTSCSAEWQFWREYNDTVRRARVRVADGFFDREKAPLHLVPKGYCCYAEWLFRQEVQGTWNENSEKPSP